MSKRSILLSLIIVGVVLRILIALMYPVTSDGCWHANVSRFISEEWKIPFDEHLGRDLFWAPFLFHMIAASGFLIFGTLGIKLVSLIPGIAIISLTYLIAREWYDQDTALTATAIASLMPNLLTLSGIVYVDSLLIFLTALTVYMLTKKQYTLAAIAIGLGTLTKYSALAIVPLCIWKVWHDLPRKEAIKTIILCAVIVAVIGSPIVIRNYTYLDNPAYPFFQDLFGGKQIGTDIAGIKPGLSNIALIPESLSITYLGLFGVPNGRWENLFFLKVPGINMIIALWLIGTLILTSILLSGIKAPKNQKGPQKTMIWGWILLFGILPFVYVMDTGIVNDVGRYAVPALPAIAIVAALGVLSLQKKPWFTYAAALMILISLGLAAGELLKAGVAKQGWDVYQEDYRQVSMLVPKDAKLYANGQCPAWYTDRMTWLIPSDGVDPSDGDFVLVNEIHRMDAMRTDGGLKIIERENSGHSTVQHTIYENNATGMKIIKILELEYNI